MVGLNLWREQSVELVVIPAGDATESFLFMRDRDESIVLIVYQHKPAGLVNLVAGVIEKPRRSRLMLTLINGWREVATDEATMKAIGLSPGTRRFIKKRLRLSIRQWNITEMGNGVTLQ